MGSGPGPSDEKEQAAEAAPEDKTQEPALQPLPAWPGQREKTLQFFQLNGYLRGRTYLLHDAALGVPLSSGGVLPSFYVPFSEAPNTSGMQSRSSCAARNGNSCQSSDITSADIRLRLEPTINVSDQVRVKAQIDVFDNLVLGSTPDGFFINGLSPSRETPLAAFSRTQVPPTAGINSLTNSINAKRAWAEVRTPIGELRFGRMPSHWGTGMFVNNGDCLDCDFGSNVDRVMFATRAFNHFLVLGYDWIATGPTTALFNPNQQNGVQYSADPQVYVQQMVLALGRQDRPDQVKEKVDHGDVVVNYGGYFVVRWQDWDLSTNPGAGSGGVATGTTPASLAQSLTPRKAWAFIPDLWFRLNYRKLSIEAEGVLIAGKIGDVSDLSQSFASANRGGLDILQYGWVAKANYRLVHDTLHIGIEIGGASGDSHEDAQGRINFRTAQPIYAGRATNFLFDPDYHVDLLLFRRIVGTVTNATYFKPHIQYDILDNLSARLDGIYSIANVAVGWPGNDYNLGVELDGVVWYHNDEEGFSAGVSYGVLFPLPGLNPRLDIYGTSVNLQTAQTLQGRIAVKF